MSRTIRALSLIALAAFLLGMNSARSATIITFTDPNAWAAAASASQTIDFEGLAPTNGATVYSSPTGLVNGGVDFIGYTATGSSWIEVVDTNFSSWYNFGSNDALMQIMDRPNASSPLPYIEITLPAGVTAVSMDLFTVSPTALPFQITINGTNYTVPTTSQQNGGETFWGFTSDTPIATIDLTVLGTNYNDGTIALLDNFTFGTGAASLSQAPEAGTFLLIGTGLIGIAGLKKLRRRPF